MRDNPRLRAARQEAALLNYGRMAEEEAKRNWRANVKRRREEAKEEEVHRRAASGGTRTTNLLLRKFPISTRIA
jgi:hypothetical protein